MHFQPSILVVTAEMQLNLGRGTPPDRLFGVEAMKPYGFHAQEARRLGKSQTTQATYHLSK